MNRSFSILLLFACFVFASGFIDLADIGYINGTSQNLKLFLEYNNGRKIDCLLDSHETRGGLHILGETLLRVRVTASGQLLYACDVERMLKNSGGKGNWLYLTRQGARLITENEWKLLKARR